MGIPTTSGIRIASIFALAISGAAMAFAAQDAKQQAPVKPVAPETQPESGQAERPDRGRRGGRGGMPQPPDWPRAGGFGPGRQDGRQDGGQNPERPMIEGLVLEGLIPSEFGRRDLTDADVARVVAVAREISPEWGDAIEARITQDAEQVKASLRTSGRRLLGMAALKERAPKVFAVKVAELRAQAETERAASELRSATELRAGAEESVASVEAIAALQKELEAAAARQVDATIAARQEELVALEDRLKKFHSDLEADSGRRGVLVGELVKRVQNRREPQRPAPPRE